MWGAYTKSQVFHPCPRASAVASRSRVMATVIITEGDYYVKCQLYT